MPVTIAEFAAQRGMSRQGVYNAIKRNGIETYQGVSNGKAAAYLSDESADKLNEILGPNERTNMILKQQLELTIQSEREQLLRETTEKVEQLLREKEVEITKTRTEMLEKIDDDTEALAKRFDKLDKALRERDQIIDVLRAENIAKDKEILTLKARIKDLEEWYQYACRHKFRFLLRGTEGDINDGENAEDKSSASSGDPERN